MTETERIAAAFLTGTYGVTPEATSEPAIDPATEPDTEPAPQNEPPPHQTTGHAPTQAEFDAYTSAQQAAVEWVKDFAGLGTNHWVPKTFAEKYSGRLGQRASDPEADIAAYRAAFEAELKTLARRPEDKQQTEEKRAAKALDDADADAKDLAGHVRVGRLRREAKRILDAEDFPAKVIDRIFGEGINALPTPHQIIEGLLIEGSFSANGGVSGVGKSAFEVGMCLAITLGLTEFLGLKIPEAVRRRAIVYMLAEGAGFFSYRCAAWLQTWYEQNLISDLRIPDNFIFSRTRLRLREHGSTIADVAAAFAADKPLLYIADTWHRHGGPELDEKEMDAAIERLNVLRDDGAAVQIVAHSPLSDPWRLRGHGSLDAAADTVAMMGYQDDKVLMKIDQRDLAPSTVWLERRTVDLDNTVDEFGKPRSACIFHRLTAAQKGQAVKREKKTDGLMKGIMAAVTLTPGITQAEICKAVGGNKANAVAEIGRLVIAKKLEITTTPGIAGKVVNHYNLGQVPF